MFEYFIYGFVFCMVADVFFSIANFFIQKALTERAYRKELQRQFHNDFFESIK